MLEEIGLTYEPRLIDIGRNASEHYRDEAKRLLAVLEARLDGGRCR